MRNPGGLVVWVDGALVEEHEARISPFDHGLLTGDGVFETLRVYRGEPYCWRRHYERLARSASGMGLAIPPDGALRRAALDLIGANRLTDARLRITVTGGPSPLGSERGRVTPTLIRPPASCPAGAGHARGRGHRSLARNERGRWRTENHLLGENVRARRWPRKLARRGDLLHTAASCARGRAPTCSS